MATSLESKILVTGASGTVGQSLAPALLQKGYKNIRLFKHRNAVEEYTDGEVEIIHADLRDFEQIQKALADVDIVCHLAALMGGNEPADIFEVNMRGTFNLLEACRLSGKVKLFIFASTDATYPAGTTEYSKPIEESQPLNPKSVYGISKVLGEEMCICYSHAFGISCVRLRFVQVVSPEIVLDLFSLNSWVGLAPEEKERIEGKDVLVAPLYADGSPVCDAVVDSRDIAQAIILCLEKPKVKGEVFNLAGPCPLNYEKEADYVSAKLGKPLVKVKCPVLKPYKVSIARAREVLGYNPIYDFRKMIDEAIADLQSSRE